MSRGLPLFPLTTVLFPGLVLPLNVFESRYRALVADLLALPDGLAREFGVIAIKRGWEVVEGATDGRPAPEVTLHEVGCTADLRRGTELPDGRYDLVTVGRRRFRIVAVDTTSGPYPRAEVEWLPDAVGDPRVAGRLSDRVLASFQRYLNLVRTGGHSDDGQSEQLPDDPTVLSYLVAATATLTVDDRQRLLAAPDTVARLREEIRLLARESALLRHIGAVPMSLAELGGPATPN